MATQEVIIISCDGCGIEGDTPLAEVTVSVRQPEQRGRPKSYTFDLCDNDVRALGKVLNAPDEFYGETKPKTKAAPKKTARKAAAPKAAKPDNEKHRETLDSGATDVKKPIKKGVKKA